MVYFSFVCFCSHQVIIPSLDDIHQAINRLLQLVMEISQGIACWGQKGRFP